MPFFFYAIVYIMDILMPEYAALHDSFDFNITRMLFNNMTFAKMVVDGPAVVKMSDSIFQYSHYIKMWFMRSIDTSITNTKFYQVTNQGKYASLWWQMILCEMPVTSIRKISLV